MNADWNEIAMLRAKPRMLLLDENLRVAGGAPEASILLKRLPIDLFEQTVTEAIEEWQEPRACAIVTRPVQNLVLRISRLAGSAGTFISILIEERTRRGDGVLPAV